MFSRDSRLPLIVVVGPTAVGKTKYAIQLAKELNGEIISADSRLFYRGMDIGTAKPSATELASVPHHLIDVAEPDDTWSLQKFQEEAKKIIDSLHGSGKVPLLVGGTGQYIRAITQAWEIPKQKPNEELRQILNEWGRLVGHEGLHDRLAVLDPVAADNIDARNVRRTVRALEVVLSTGIKFSNQRIQGESEYRVLVLGLTRPRPELYERIDQRIEKMLDQGFVEEVKHLLELGYSPDLSSMSAIGYKQIADYINGDISLKEAVVLIKRFTRQYVRRQANWFKPNASDITWLEVNNDLVESMFGTAKEFLSII